MESLPKGLEVTPMGTLELLAYGDVGLFVWRRKREEFKKDMANKTKVILKGDRR